MEDIKLPKEWVCIGGELKAKVSPRASETWVHSGKELKPKVGATNRNSFDLNGYPILVAFGQLILKLW